MRDSVKPVVKAARSGAMVENQGYTYNELGITYNQISVMYGGIAGDDSRVPILSRAKQEKPMIITARDF
jgi:hypothetical protein